MQKKSVRKGGLLSECVMLQSFSSAQNFIIILFLAFLDRALPTAYQTPVILTEA